MAAITQTDADKAGISHVRYKFTGATNDVYGVLLGSIGIIIGDGDPNGEITAPLGSFFIKNTAGAGALWINTDGSSAWISAIIA